MRIALVSREFYPYVGGGIAPIVAAAAKRLAAIADVTVVTSAHYRERHEAMRRTGDPRLVPDSVRVVFAEEPDPVGIGGFNSLMHAYSAQVHKALKEQYGARGPDVIEFCDYLGEGFVTVQDRRTGGAWLDSTLVCVRLHTTAEICNVLDGHMRDDFATIAAYEAERYVLRHADRVLWSGGDVLATYRRFYGDEALAPDKRISDAFLVEDATCDVETGAPSVGRPLRFLYLGRLERRKGIQNLVRAMLAIRRNDWSLTVLGGDTRTGPLEISLRDQLEAIVADDERVRFVDHVERADVGSFIARHDVVVAPSLWECWPNVVREALLHNRPVLGTPVGGLLEMVVPGRSGWLADDTTPEALVRAVVHLLDQHAEVTSLIASRAPRKVFDELTDLDAFLRSYRELAGEEASAAPTRPRSAARPLVSVVVPYFRLEAHVEETLRSIAEQTYPRVETIVVNDGSLRESDALVYEIGDPQTTRVITQVNSGLGAARNFGISQAFGRYVLPLDADDCIAPTFIERCVHALERDENLAYVTSWARYMTEEGAPFDHEFAGYMPFGNWSRLIERNNVGGTCTSVFRRRVFERGFRYSHDMTSYEDWLLYWEMNRAGLFGGVIPEPLFDYRVRTTSIMRSVGAPLTERLYGELRALLRERTMTWTAAT